MILETERLTLRPWRMEDAEVLYALASDPEVGPPAGWPPHKSAEESREIIKSVFSAPEIYAVCLKESGRIVGCVGLHRNDLAAAEGEYELGYWAGKSFWGQGIVPEAARALLRHAFTRLNMERIWCGYYEGNEKSRRVQDKLGFLYHHTTEGVYIPFLGEKRTGHAMLMTRERFNKVELFLAQKQTLDTFLKKGAITPAQYGKSFGDLKEFMNMQEVK